MGYWLPSSQSDDEEKKKEAAERNALLRQFLSPEARQRLRNVALVKPDLVNKVENLIIRLGLEDKLDHPLSDEEIKEILYKLQKKHSFHIRGF